MKRPTFPAEALEQIQTLLMAALKDIDAYMENPHRYEPEYFRSVSGAVADAHLLTTWVKDTLSFDTGGE